MAAVPRESLSGFENPDDSELFGVFQCRQQQVVVILLNDLPTDLWQDSVRYQDLYLFQPDLVRARGVFNRLR